MGYNLRQLRTRAEPEGGIVNYRGEQPTTPVEPKRTYL